MKLPPPAASAVTWCNPVPPPRRAPYRPALALALLSAPAGCCDGDVNYDPPPWSAGTGLMQSQPDGSIVVNPLSVVEPGCPIGDEGPINEAFLSSPVVRLAAGRPFALSSEVVIPDGATLHVNRAVIDREMFRVGEGAAVYD